MERCIQMLRRRMKEDKALMNSAEKLLRNCLEGSVQITTVRGNPKCYWIKDGQRSYLRKEDYETVKSLAQKNYYQKLLKVTEKEWKLLQGFIEQFAPESLMDVYENMSEQRKHLVDPLILPDDQFVEKWLEESRAIAGLHRNSYEKPEGFRTENGELVRSKSEMILANLYRHLHVPYVYEYPVKLEDGWVFSDFRALNVRLRKPFLHEHFGKMDDPEYARDSVVKMGRYERYGLYAGDQILYTMETSERPLNVDDVERMIRRYLL